MHKALVMWAAVGVCLAGPGCASVTTLRVQPEAVDVGPGLRPMAAVQANAASAYVLFIPLPGGVDLDRVINRMLVATAKLMGADKIAQLTFEITPDAGIWKLRRLLGWRSARASGIAVQVVDAPDDPGADDGPEPAAPASPAPEPPGSPGEPAGDPRP